jgi:phosphatidylserine synthase
MGATSLFMAVAAWREWPWWEYAFLSDGSPVAWLSSALLLANAALALNAASTRVLDPWIGYGVAIGLAIFAIDEQFQLHEQLKASTGPGWQANVPIFAIGAVGVAFLFISVRRLRRVRPRALFSAAVLVGLLALWVDVGPAPSALAPLEEGYEVLAESLFLCALLELSGPQVQSRS